MTILLRRAMQTFASTVIALLLGIAAAGCGALPIKPLPPRIEVEGVRSAALAGNALTLTVVLKVHNPNPFPVPLRELEAEVAIDDTATATARLPAPITLAAQGDTPVDIEARSDAAVLGGVVERALRTGRIAYAVSGFARLEDGRRLDFRRRGELSVADLLGRRR